MEVFLLYEHFEYIDSLFFSWESISNNLPCLDIYYKIKRFSVNDKHKRKYITDERGIYACINLMYTFKICNQSFKKTKETS